MLIGRIERYVGPVELGYKQRVSQYIVNCKHVQVGENIEHGRTTFKEVIIKGHNYFKRFFYTLNKKGERIEGSMFSETLTGEEANKREIRHFGVIG
jgi:hypothetical protein